jgi:lysophospholipase L1-like esterase
MKNIFSVILLFISITSFAQLPTLPQKQVLHLSDSLAKKVDSSIIRNDSLFQYKNGFEYFRGKIIGSGTTDTSHLSLRIDSMQRFADMIDIRAFGGVADGLTDNQPAMLAAKASAPAGALIWLKMRGTGIYYFDNTDTSLFNNTKIYCEEGVIIKLSTENLHSLNSVTPVKVVLGSLNNQDMMYYPQDPNIEHIDNEPIRDNVIIRYPVQGTLFTEHQTSNWAQLSGEPLVVDATKITADSNHFTLSSANSPSNGMKVGIIDAVPGATISACARNSNAWALMWAENSWGYMVCYGGFTVQVRKFGDPNTGIGNQQLNINGLLNNPTPYLNYGTDKAICSMRLSDDGKTIEFLHNGVNRANQQFTLGGQAITKWGFGAYGAGVSTVSWYDFIMEYNRKQPAANETVHVQVFGDSQVGYFQGSSWLKYFQQYLDNSYGYKIDTLENYAVSGETMEQQKTRFDAVTHKGVTIVLAGTNNIQAQSSLTTMIAALNGMVDSLNYTNNLSSSTVGVLNPGNKKLIVCIPPMFYSYALNGNKGKASSNYELGGAYRMAILRWAASRNVMVVDLPSVMGPTTQRAALLRDDIHPSDLGAAVIGREVAKKYIALVSGTTAASVFVVKDGDTVFVRGVDTANAKMVNYLKIQKNGIIINAIGDTLGAGGVSGITYSGADFIVNGTSQQTGAHFNIDGYAIVDTIYGSTASGGNLYLYSTSHATKGKIYFGTNNVIDVANNKFGIGTTSPIGTFHLYSPTSNLFATFDDGTDFIDLFSQGSAAGFDTYGDFIIRAKTYANRGSGSWDHIIAKFPYAGLSDGTGVAKMVTTTNGLLGYQSIPIQNLNSQYTDVSNSGSSETDLYSFPIPLNTLTSNGDWIDAEYDGTFNTPTSAVLKFYVAGDVSTFTGISAVQRWHMQAKLIRTSSTTIRKSVILFGDFNNVIGEFISDITGVDFTTTNTIKITGQDASSTKITAKMSTVVYHH